MLDHTGASSKCAEQRDSDQQLRALAEGGCRGYLHEVFNKRKIEFVQ